MTRLPLALLLLAGVCWAQDATVCLNRHLAEKGLTDIQRCLLAKDGDSFSVVNWQLEKNEPLNQCIVLGKKLLAELKSCREEVNLTIDAFDQCTTEENKPHLPLSVNPGDCFEVQADMSLKMIPCPKEGEQ